MLHILQFYRGMRKCVQRHKQCVHTARQVHSCQQSYAEMLLQYKGTCVTEHVVGSISQDVLQLESKHCYLMYNKQILQTTVSPTHV